LTSSTRSLVFGYVHDRTGGARYADVVYENVESAEGIECMLHGRPRIRGHGDVPYGRARPPPGGNDRVDRLSRRFVGAVHDDHRCAFLGQTQRHRPPVADTGTNAAAAGD
jgi:hypothetical protein